MKTSRRTITFFSFFPAVALLATPLLFSTLAPASTDDFTFAVDSSDWIVPQSFMTTDEILEAQSIRNKDIGEVKFLQYDRDYIYMADDTDDDTVAVDDSRNAPALTDQGEIDTAYVLQNPEFQRQVEEVSAQATQAGATMPPLLTLIALFAFAVATGTSSLKDFFKFSTYTEKVKKTIQVTKKVAKTVYRTITETVARKVKTIKQVAYTAYETNVVQVTQPPSIDKLDKLARFMRKSVKENPSFSRPFERNARYYLPNMSDRSEWDNFTIEYGGIATGTRVGGTVHRLQEYFSSPAHTNVERSFETISDYFFEGIRFTEPALYEKLKEEFDAIVQPVIEPPVVDLTGTPYTAYREEIETTTVYEEVTREVPETIYEDVVENHEVVEDVTKYSFTPLNEKIDLAMGYLKNYQKILQSPSNRSFPDSVLIPNRDLPIFAGAYDVYEKLVVELKNANVYNMDRTDPEGVKEILRRHNEFIYSMKTKLAQIEQGKTPEEQMTLLFGKDYTDSVTATENAIAETEADEKALTARFNEIEEMLRTNKISTGYYRSLYNSAKRNRDQLYRRQRDAEKNLKKTKEYYASKFNTTVASLQNLSFLRSLEDWRHTLDQGDRSVAAARLVQFTTANGSVIYRKPSPSNTTTVAQPKKTIQQKTPSNLTTANTKYLDAFMRVPNNLPAEPKDSLPPSQSIAKKEAQFALKHPEIAKRIGVYDRDNPKLNISSTAVNFMINSQLKQDFDGAVDNESGQGSEYNAIRHTIWQALITKEFGIRMAKEAGDAHEADSNADLSLRTFTDIDKADATVDLLNNAVGRSIGNNHKKSMNVEIALRVLKEFKEDGLWTVKKNTDGTYSIQKTKITAEQYAVAYGRMKLCNEYGYSPDGWKSWLRNEQMKIENRINIQYNAKLS